MTIDSRMRFTLRVGPLEADALMVRRLGGQEELSAPFQFVLDLVPVSGEPLDLASLRGAEANLSIRRPGCVERWVNGLCGQVAQLGTEAGKPVYRAFIVPKLALLALATGSRVYQEQSAVEIVGAVLREHGVAFRSELRGSYPSREMCIQYRESALTFVARLLEEEGIGYWFEHQEGGHTLVLGDAPDAFPVLAGGEDWLPYRRDIGQVAEEEHVFELRRTQALQPGASTLRDYDFKRPGLDVTGGAADGAGPEVYDYPSGNVDQGETKRLSQARLQELRRDAEVWRGQANCERLESGRTFAVMGHPRPEFDARLLVMKVTHRGVQQTGAGEAERIEGSYRVEFVAIGADRQYRPERKAVRPVIRGVQTATVVGPAGEEIYPDAYGRIKVQFHWDREGQRDERSSAWVRLAQSWAGPGFGAVFVPRIGQEVVLRLLEGNPDRPLVIGAVYNGQHPTAVELPAEKTKSTLKTDSSPHSGGSNELRFEDAAGSEEIYVHGQKDETIQVLNDKDQKVHDCETLRVDRDRSRSVGGNQTLWVALDDASKVEGNQTLGVLENRDVWVGGSHEEDISGKHAGVVRGSRHVSIRKESQETIGAASALTVGGSYDVNVGKASNESVGMIKAVQVMKNRDDVVKEDRAESIGGDCTAAVVGDFASGISGSVKTAIQKNLTEDTGNSDIKVEQPVSWTAGKFDITADSFELIVGGKVVLSLDKSGSLLLAGTTVTLGGAAVTLKGSPLGKSGPGSVQQKRLALKKLAELKAAPAFVGVRLLDQHGRPVANERFRVMLPDGSIRSGATDAKGEAKVPSSRAGSCKVMFPGLDPSIWRKI